MQMVIIKGRNMNNLRRSNSGVSVIIGALMLTIIVVTAAVSFAVFAADKQERLQSAELAELNRNLEDITIIGIKSESLNYLNSNLTRAGFDIGSLHAGDSTISSIRVNGFFLQNFTVERQNRSWENYSLNHSSYEYRIYSRSVDEGNNWSNIAKNDSYRFKILASESVTIQIRNTLEDLIKKTGENISENDPITIEILTSLTNEFSQSFIPPTANIKIVKESDSTTIALDSSSSDHPGETGYIINYRWDVTCTQFSFKPYTFRDLDGNWTFDGDEFSVVNDSVNTSGSTPLAGQPGGLYALDDSNISFTFIDADGDWEYDIDEVNISKNVSGFSANPKPGNQGGLFANDTTGKPYTFKDYDLDWEFDIEYTVNLNPDTDSVNASPRHDDKGGIYANDSKGEPYIFQDVNGNWQYDIGEKVINYNPNNSSSNADPSEGERGGLYANDSSKRNYTFTDYDGDWEYDKETIVNVSDGATPKSGEYGGLYANDTDGNHYTFIDENGNWRYDNETIIINKSGFQASEQYIGCLWAYDNQSEPYIFFDNGNWEYDSGESLINDDPDNDGKATPKNGQKGHLYGNSSNNESFTFIDSNHNWQYDRDEIVNINPENDGIAIPIFGDPGGLYAVNGMGVYNFTFIDGNGNKIYDGEIILSFDPDKNGPACPTQGDPAGLYVNVSGRVYSFKDVNGNWSFDTGETVVEDYSGNGNNTTDSGGLFVDSSIRYTFKDENKNWRYDDELLCNFSSVSVSPSAGDPGGLYALDTSNEPYTFIDADGDWQYDNETLELDPLNRSSNADPEPGQQGGLYAAVDVETTYHIDYGMKKTFTFPQETWRKIFTLITLTVTDNFGMIGTDSYSYWNK